MNKQRMILRLVACASMLSASIALSAERASDSEPAFTARWLPACYTGEQRTYFALDVFDNGQVRYTGGRQAREQGQKILQISRSDARRLASRAADFSRGSSSPARQPEQGLPPDACVEVTSNAAGEKRVRRESIEIRAGGALTDAIARAVPVRDLACPGRTTPDDPALKIAAVCGRWQNPPRIAANFGDEKGCPSFHEVSIYDDGTVYYAAHERQPNPGAMPSPRIAGDAYYALSRESLQQLEKLLATLNLEQTRFDEPNPRRRDNSPFSTSNPQEVARFRDALANAAGIRWVTMTGSGNPNCSPLAYLSMRADAWRRLSR